MISRKQSQEVESNRAITPSNMLLYFLIKSRVIWLVYQLALSISSKFSGSIVEALVSSKRVSLGRHSLLLFSWVGFLAVELKFFLVVTLPAMRLRFFPDNLYFIMPWILSWMLAVLSIFIGRNKLNLKVPGVYSPIISMTDPLLFETVEYRNGIYQGTTQLAHPAGLGLFLDDQSVLCCSTWSQGLPQKRTAVFISHGKYLYGEWQAGKPHGFNVFRSGDTVLLGGYDNGVLQGKFMIIFERQKFVAIVSGLNDADPTIQKKYFSSDQELKFMTNKHFQSMVKPDDFFSFVLFLKQSFCPEDGVLRLQVEEEELRFGYARGLGVIFDDDNYIKKVGFIDQARKMAGLGAVYGTSNEEGNFQTANTLRYTTGNRPIEKLRKLYKGEHKKSIFFRNDYMSLKTSTFIQHSEGVLKSIIEKLVQISQTDRSKSGELSSRELNDSLEYHQRTKTIDQGDRIRRIKAQLEGSIGKAGSEIRPKYAKNNPRSQLQDLKQLYISPAATGIIQADGIDFKKPISNTVSTNRRLFMDRNHLTDYRLQYGPYKYSRNGKALPAEDPDDSLKMFRKQPEDKITDLPKDKPEPQIHQMKPVGGRVQEVLSPKPVQNLSQNPQNTSPIKGLQSPLQALKTPVFPPSSFVMFTPPKIQTKDVPAQTSFQTQREDSLNLSRQAYLKNSQKSTAVKKVLPQIHFNPFLRTFVSTKYPPFPQSQQPFQHVERVVHNIQTPLPNTSINAQHREDQEIEDSLEKIKRLKDQRKPPKRYIISDQPNQSDKLQPNIKDSGDKMSSLPIHIQSVPDVRALFKQTIHEQHNIERPSGKTYLEIYKTTTAVADKQRSGKSRSRSPIPKGLSPNVTKKSNHSPAPRDSRPSTNLRQYTGQKTIDIEHQRTSPQGKKSITYQKIIKKYHYVSQYT